MPEAMDAVGRALPFVAIGVSLVGGLVALILDTRARLQERPDRRAARQTGAVVSLAVGAVAGLIMAGIGASFGGGTVDPVRFLQAAAFLGGLVAAVVLGASLTGYAALALARPRGSAVAGAVLGPLVLGGAAVLSVGLTTTAQRLSSDAFQAQQQAEVDARSTGLHLTVDRVEATVDAAGLVQVVHLQLHLRSDTDLALEQLPGKLTYPLFMLLPGGADDPNAELQAEAPIGSPAMLEAGSETGYDVTFDVAASGAQPSRPGAWQLRVGFGGADGQAYGVETTITVAG